MSQFTSRALPWKTLMTTQATKPAPMPLVMEYVNGRDASDIIRAAQLAGREVPPPLATYVVREMLKGLYYAHTKTDADKLAKAVAKVSPGAKLEGVAPADGKAADHSACGACPSKATCGKKK